MGFFRIDYFNPNKLKNMKIKCPNCPQVYNIPKERFPAGQKKVAFPCPNCKALIKIEINEGGTTESSAGLSPSNRKAESDPERLRKEIMRSVTDLPPLPQVVIKAHEIMADTGSTFKELGDVIETDQAIAGRVLKLANSAYYGLRGMVSSIHQASVVLGFEALGELITVVGAAGLLDSILKGYRLESGSLWQHSLVVAFGSRMIARKKDPKMENNAFSAGLLHDAGKIVLNEYVLEKEDAFDSFLKAEGRTFLEAEKKILGFDHAEISADLCRKWSLPELQCSAIRYHHYPSKSGGNMLAGIIHISDILAMRSGAGTGFDSMLYEMEAEAFEQVGLSTNELEEVITKTLESVDKISDQIHK